MLWSRHHDVKPVVRGGYSDVGINDGALGHLLTPFLWRREERERETRVTTPYAPLRGPSPPPAEPVGILLNAVPGDSPLYGGGSAMSASAPHSPSCRLARHLPAAARNTASRGFALVTDRKSVVGALWRLPAARFLNYLDIAAMPLFWRSKQ
jgi:hypothetical protein